MGNPDSTIGEIKDWDSTGWEHIFNRFQQKAKELPVLANAFLTAKIGFDLGSGGGQSAYALNLLCPHLTVLHTVDNRRGLYEPFKTVLAPIVVEHGQKMQDFVATMSGNTPKADIVMIASSQGQPFFESEDLQNLALSIRAGGVLIDYNPDYSHIGNKSPMTDFFTSIHHREDIMDIWTRN